MPRERIKKMNELTKMGFIYDVTQFSPNGDIVCNQKIHNIIPLQGIFALYKSFFWMKDPSTNTWYSCSGKNNSYTYWFFNFMQSDYVPKQTDTWNYEAKNLYGCDGSIFDSFLGGTNPLMIYSYRTTDKKNYPTVWELTLGSDNLVKLKNDISIVFTEFKTLTGIFVGMIDQAGYSENTNWDSISSSKYISLLSAALFYTPIQMVPGGTLKLNCAFTLIPQ